MVTTKLDDGLHQIIKDNLNILKFRVDYRDVKGFVDKAVYKLLVEKGLIKEVDKK